VKISADGDGKHIEDYKIEYTPLDGLEAEVYDGLQ
jgi:hypothetical protein